MKSIAIFLSAVLSAVLILAGCLSRPDFARINIGMSKEEVIARIGEPRNIAAQSGLEIFTYEGEASYADGKLGGEFYYVRFVNGKVESYGNKGDFDSTKNPAMDINIKTN